jgi:hypothetical protein
MKICIMQKQRVAYFDCTAVPGDNSLTLSHAAQPSFSSLASLVQPRSRRAMVDVFGWRKSFGDLNLRRNESRRSR